MLDLSTAVLCDFAQVRDRLLFVSSGAVSRLYRRELPSPLGLMVGLVIEVPLEESGIEHSLRADVVNRHGAVLATLQNTFRVGDEGLFPHEVQQVPLVLSITGVRARTWGTHQVRLSLDNELVRALTLYVVPAAGIEPARAPARAPEPTPAPPPPPAPVDEAGPADTAASEQPEGTEADGAELAAVAATDGAADEAAADESAEPVAEGDASSDAAEAGASDAAEAGDTDAAASSVEDEPLADDGAAAPEASADGEGSEGEGEEEDGAESEDAETAPAFGRRRRRRR